MTSSPELNDLIERAQAFDGSAPFSDGALAQFANGERELVWERDATGALVGAALDSPLASEFVIDPDARGLGHGARMLDMLTHPSRGGASTAKLFWAHGDHPASRALARHHKLESVRTLLHLRVDPLPSPLATGGVVVGTAAIRPFVPADAPGWLELNARTFAGHPDQGGVTRGDLDAIMAEPWFDAADFLLLEDGAELVAYCWLKRTGDTGEFYVVGVDPQRQGEGLGQALMVAGFARLRERGIRSAHLYVEGDNAPALRLYRGYGFVDASVDVQYHYTR